ncbi:MAG: hypothetical protein ACFB11_00895 [Paracoccaceae bacterium]
MLGPESFRDRPYYAALNQIGHPIVGASAVKVLGADVNALWWTLVLVIFWELRHFFLSLDWVDSILDWLFMLGGAIVWFIMIDEGWVLGPGEWFPVLVLAGGALIYALFSIRKHINENRKGGL